MKREKTDVLSTSKFNLLIRGKSLNKCFHVKFVNLPKAEQLSIAI